MPGHLREALFVSVEFLKRGHRQVDVVLFKAKEARGVVHQDIRVQYKELCRPA